MYQTQVSRDGCLLWLGEAYGPRFADQDDALAFVEYVEARTGLDPRQQSDAWLERVADEWVKS